MSQASKTCTKCKEAKQLVDFHKDKRTKDGRDSWCKSCCNIASKDWISRNKERVAARKKQWYNENRERMDFIAKAKLYGINEEQLQELHAKKNCPICGTELTTGKGGRAIDHCHKSGKVRDILCSDCNKGLGFFKDDVKIMKAAIQYLLDKGVEDLESAG